MGPKEVNGVDSGGESCWRRQAGWVPLVAAETRKRPAWSVADEENTRSERMRARKRTTGRERESTERGEFERRDIGEIKAGEGEENCLSCRIQKLGNSGFTMYVQLGMLVIL